MTLSETAVAGPSFELTEEQRMLQDMVRDFATSTLAPRAAAYDRSCEFPHDNVKEMAELGLLGVTVPDTYGGAGMDTLAYTIVIEEIAKACASTAVIAAVQNSLVNFPLMKFGTEEQKKKYLPKLASGELIGAYSLTEPGSGSDAVAMQTRVRKEGNKYILNGTKVFVTNATGAELFIVYATLDPELKSKGVCAFIIEKNYPGFSVGRHEEMMGVRASGTSELILDNCEVPLENLLGTEGEGFKIALATLDVGRLGIAAQAIGIAQACLDYSLGYAQERKQFGKAIATFQLIQNKLVEMAVNIDAARMLLWRAAWLRERGQNFTKEASMAKLFASETAMKAGIEAVQVLGGYGYTKDYPVERYFRDAKITQIYEGTAEVQKIVIARHLTNPA
ncbi:MAG: acyl-CoA dehydrogenase [Armatimonadetes bacterium]|nr:acyl-CoA dehydrogenase [Armatimonadota bacterium]